MTIEQKARAYDKAIEKIKYIMEHGVSPVLNKEDLQDIFPELAESEDERIRKKLIKYFQDLKGGWFGNISHDDILAWLEKQAPKPQRIISAEAKEALYDKPKWTEEDEENFRDIISAIHSVAYQTTEDEEARIEWLKSLKKRWRNNNETCV